MLYYVQGSALITKEEFVETIKNYDVQAFYDAVSKGLTTKTIKFSTGELSIDNVLKGFVATAGAPPVPFKPIGTGSPLTVQIREVYTGKYPSKNMFGSKKDMLVTSAIKSITSFDAKPLAMNFLLDKVSPQSHIGRGPASKQGTPFIFYSPALIEKSLTLDISIIFDSFPEEAFTQVGKLFSEVSSVPIFLSCSVYLMAAGIITKLVGKAGEKLFDGKPMFASSDPLDIDWPGASPLSSGFMLITSSDVDHMDPEFRKKYQVNDSGKVVDSLNNEYHGDIPFVVISLDGTPQEELTSFTSTAASAALLSRFYGIKDGQEQSMGMLLDAVKIYNDFNFRQQVDRLDAQISSLPDGNAKKDELKKKREALVNNILEDIMKPK